MRRGVGGSARAVVEGLAWRVPLSSRRFFQVLAATTGLVVFVTGIFATVVAARNADRVAEARDHGLLVSQSVTEFRNQLGLADAQVATILVTGRAGRATVATAGEAETRLGRAHYDTAILDAGLALTEAAIVSSGEEAEDVALLAEGLVRYAELVDTSREYPVGSVFVQQARETARDELVPTADEARRSSEQELLRTARRAGNATSRWAVASLVGAGLVLVAAGTLVAGRTRRVVHPANLLAFLVLLAVAARSGTAMLSQSDTMKSAADGEIESYEAANGTLFALLDLRVCELDAVARPDDSNALYDRFRAKAAAMLDRLDEEGETADVLRAEVEAYAVAVAASHDREGDPGAAAAVTLEGSSSVGYEGARGLVTDEVARSSDDLDERLASAASGGASPAILSLAGLVAAVLAVAGILRRGRSYLREELS